MMRRRTIRTPEKREVFCAALGDGLSVTAACRAAAIGRMTAYEWRGADADFARAWDEAIEAGTDLLEDVALRRAQLGSDTLVIFLLKARRPEKFKDRAQIDKTETINVTVTVDDEQRAKAMALLLAKQQRLAPH